MIEVSNIDVWGFEHAIRGMRNPLNSWNKSDSMMCYVKKFSDCKSDCEKCPRKNEEDFDNDIFCVGKNDLDLMRRLYKAGSEHRKYLRQIFVSMDILAPLYWWKEMDQYRINVTTNSCSTMHKIHAKEFTLDDFSHDHLFGDDTEMDVDESVGILNIVISALNDLRDWYNKENDKEYWHQMIQLLPSSYNQKRTVTMNYENVITIIKQRTGHKLDEWNQFVEILKSLPYVKEIISEGE